MGAYRFDKTKPTSWYLMELVREDPVAYRCVQAHFKSRLDCATAMHDLIRSRSIFVPMKLEVWDDIVYTRWFWTLGTGFGEGTYGV